MMRYCKLSDSQNHTVSTLVDHPEEDQLEGEEQSQLSSNHKAKKYIHFCCFKRLQVGLQV